jgi:hypothetical protein
MGWAAFVARTGKIINKVLIGKPERKGAIFLDLNVYMDAILKINLEETVWKEADCMKSECYKN